MENPAKTEIDVREIMKKLICHSDQNPLYNESNSKYDPTLPLNEKIVYLSHIIHLSNTRYTIHSHRKIIGRLMVFIRGLIASENRRYIDPIIHQQNSVNSVFLEILEHLAQENAKLKNEIEHLKQVQDTQRRYD